MSRLLLLSSSRAGTTGYLDHAQPLIADFLNANPTPIRRVLFIPFAGVGKTFDAYLEQVRPAFAAIGLTLESLHQAADPIAAVRDAEAVAVGGGNTFALVKRLYDADLLDALRERVAAGRPFIGWSAGSNIAGPTLCTTNDMPIVEPPSFTTLGLVPFQINPHFISGKVAGHNGESREERLAEYLALNPEARVVALREGTALRRDGDSLTLVGELDGVSFTADGEQSIAAGSRLDDLLTTRAKA
ncbi:dipeptidase PepE [Salinicola rhizosphaerae]|uniref:Peptidase E n=1 Tax=Salinicola rhizosphaerae TaxID=1443141 RepID=A0ABQ3DTQ0_9GAMM|nr:dipeptidase PepE [Salinicola rhizosphaerae]GHB14864.1 peptidase E [Salinicola rhizosphaerae]